MSTPLMKQYAQVKARYPDTLLLFRMGDFFETFEEDARITSRVLGITLTRRGNGAAGEVPLAGFPHHALDGYLPKLVRAGYRVAVCEQLEDPRFAKGIVKRDVIEVVTPGVAYSDKVLEAKQNNFLAAVALPSAVAAAGDTVGLAFIDVSTAEFFAAEFPLRDLPAQITALHPSEIVVQRRDLGPLQELLRGRTTALFTRLEDWIFHRDFAYEQLVTHFATRTLKGFGVEDFQEGIIAAGAVLQYLRDTQKSNLEHIRRIQRHDAGDTVVLDPSTKRNLEITSSLAGGTEGTLFGVLDRTRTPMGGRLLKRWVHRPLRVIAPIAERLDAVGELVADQALREDLFTRLADIGDIERLVARICTARATPREVRALARMVGATAGLRSALTDVRTPLLTAVRTDLHELKELVELVDGAIEADPPATLADGGVIRQGYNAELDEVRGLARDGKSWIAALQQQERERTGISSLKVGYNNVFGYYIEITNAHREKVPAEYIRKQTLTGAERYITPGLKEYEEKVLHAQERILALESRLFNDVRTGVAAHAAELQTNARLVATLDCLLSLAGAAHEHRYCRPDVNEGTLLEIIEGRHPVIERLLPPGESYVPNSVRLDTESQQILIITGPNMSGKSSFLRQTGLIVLLAQIGSFVPATRATVGLVDTIFTRVGASDNITSGESTFLVEMHEAAHIVNSATSRSLVLLDELGRGTSTFDGISIAWALTEYIHERLGARTLFATHYHELNELADMFPRIRNLKVDVREYGDKVVFLHTVTPGFADHSYGIQVARMAGLPEEVTARAQVLLRNLEGSELSVHGEGEAARRPAGRRLAAPPVQLTLFEMKDDALRQELRTLNIDGLTPLEALQKLADLKRRAE